VHQEVDLEEGDLVREVWVGDLGEREEEGEVRVCGWEVGAGGHGCVSYGRRACLGKLDRVLLVGRTSGLPGAGQLILQRRPLVVQVSGCL
jgi:hypothetical protein